MSSINEPVDFCFDAIVCGSGAAGCVIAVELAKSGMSVILLEASDIKDGSLEHISDKINVHGKRSPLYNFARQLGGSTNLWSGRTSFFEPVDFSLNNWPLSYEELEADITAARNIINAPEPTLDEHIRVAFSGFWSTLAKPPFSLKRFIMQHRISPFNAYSYLKGQQLSNLKVWQNIAVRRVLHDGGDIAVGLEVYDRATDSLKSLRGGLFVLATGGLDVPRLLLESNLPAHTSRTPIGQYLSTHPKLHIGTLKLSGKRRANNALLSDIFLGGQYVRLGLGLDSEALKREKLLNHYLQVSPVFEAKTEDFLDVLIQRSKFLSYVYGRGGKSRSVLQFIGRLYFILSQRMAGKLGYYSAFKLKLHCDQYPSQNHRVSLSERSTDSKTKRINIDWSFTTRDYNDARSFLLKVKHYVEDAGLGTVDLEDFVHDNEWPMVGIHSHFMGTTRMGNDQKTSVTDAFGKLHGFKNIYIGGPSLFTGYGYTNPVLPIVVLAIRTARSIVSGQNRKPLKREDRMRAKVKGHKA